MRLDAISLKLRPREAYEATDLGIRLVQRNLALVFRPWCLLLLPIMLALLSLSTLEAWLAVVAIWWLKPFYDRMVLFVLSRAVFGERVSVGGVMAAWREWLFSGLFAALTWRRFDFARAFVLPIDVLERLSWRRRWKRNRTLQRNTRSQAALTQIAFMHIEVAVYLSLIVLVILFTPNNLKVDITPFMFGAEVPMWWTWVTGVFYITAITLIEPFYVAAEFALYLNRRVALEAWDIEVDLKRGLEHDARREARLREGVDGFAPGRAA